MRKAFTLVELLIVIAILGILTVSLLIALDPLEQTRRATDTTVLRSAGDVKNAIDRYYALKLYFPWCDPGSPPGGCIPSVGSGCAADTSESLNTSCGTAVLTELVNTGELKINPPPNMTAAIYLALGAGASSFNVAFDPVSKTYDTNQNTKYIDKRCNTVDPGTTCATAPNTCFYCF